MARSPPGFASRPSSSRWPPWSHFATLCGGRRRAHGSPTCRRISATLNAVRFNQVPSNSGLGLELKVIAAVAVGGAAITGGSATILGTVLGVILLGIIGPALTFLGISAYWEQALQGAIILLAVSANVLQAYRKHQMAGAAFAG